MARAELKIGEEVNVMYWYIPSTQQARTRERAHIRQQCDASHIVHTWPHRQWHRRVDREPVASRIFTFESADPDSHPGGLVSPSPDRATTRCLINICRHRFRV
jgi:hypothetical protein